MADDSIRDDIDQLLARYGSERVLRMLRELKQTESKPAQRRGARPFTHERDAFILALVLLIATGVRGSRRSKSSIAADITKHCEIRVRRMNGTTMWQRDITESAQNTRRALARAERRNETDAKFAESVTRHFIGLLWWITNCVNPTWGFCTCAREGFMLDFRPGKLHPAIKRGADILLPQLEPDIQQKLLSRNSTAAF